MQREAPEVVNEVPSRTSDPCSFSLLREDLTFDCVYCQGDYVASEEDGSRPYSLFFFFSWFQEKEKKPDPTPQADLMEVGQVERSS